LFLNKPEINVYFQFKFFENVMYIIYYIEIKTDNNIIQYTATLLKLKNSKIVYGIKSINEVELLTYYFHITSKDLIMN